MIRRDIDHPIRAIGGGGTHRKAAVQRAMAEGGPNGDMGDDDAANRA
ncbi:MAG: hypothetical protein ACR2PL_04500 [Dehalococcoidia bacterium]